MYNIHCMCVCVCIYIYIYIIYVCCIKDPYSVLMKNMLSKSILYYIVKMLLRKDFKRGKKLFYG